MISRIYLSKGLYTKSLQILWSNVDMLVVEASIRMNEYIKYELPDSPKMEKWGKYFILTLL